MNPILWSDVETTGTDSIRCAITQIASALEIDGKIVDTFIGKMRPHKDAVVEREALEIQEVTEKEIRDWPDPVAVYAQYYGWMKKHGHAGNKQARFIPAGYNHQFDLDFMSSWFERETGGPYAFWDFLQFKPIDPFPWIVTLWRYGRLPVVDCQLGTVCACLGIELKAHDPMSDIMATREVTRQLLANMMDVF
jgi:DNA polymerase III epsilon subunit-like protein